MSVRPTLSEITKVLQNAGAKPTRAWQERVRAELRILSELKQSPLAEKQKTWSWFALWRMPWLGAACAFVLILGGVWWHANALPEYEQHLREARIALNQIKEFNAGAPITAQSPSFFSSATAETPADENTIAILVQTTRDELNAAVAATVHLSDSTKLTQALNEIETVQNEALDIVSDTLLHLQDKKVIATVADVLEITAERKKFVRAQVKQIKNLENSIKDRQIARVDTLAAPETMAISEQRTKAVPQKTAEISVPVPSSFSQKIAEAPLIQAKALPEAQIKLKTAKSLLPISAKKFEKNAELQLAEAVTARIERSPQDFPERKKAKFKTLKKILTHCAEQASDCDTNRAKGLAIGLNADQNEAEEGEDSGKPDQQKEDRKKDMREKGAPNSVSEQNSENEKPQNEDLNTSEKLPTLEVIGGLEEKLSSSPLESDHHDDTQPAGGH